MAKACASQIAPGEYFSKSEHIYFTFGGYPHSKKFHRNCIEILKILGQMRPTQYLLKQVLGNVGRAERLPSGTDGQKWPWDAHGPVGTRCLVLSGIEKKYDLPYSAPNGPERERLGVGRLRGSISTFT